MISQWFDSRRSIRSKPQRRSSKNQDKRTLANSFASPPPELMMAFQLVHEGLLPVPLDEAGFLV